MRKEAAGNEDLAAKFTEKLLKLHGLNPKDSPKIFNETVTILDQFDMSKNTLPEMMRTDKDVLKQFELGKQKALDKFSLKFTASDIPVKVNKPFFKNWKLILPSAIGATIGAGLYYRHRMKKKAGAQRILGMALRGYRMGVKDAEKEFEKEMGRQTKGLKMRLSKLTKGRPYKLTKKAGGPGSGTKENNTLPIKCLEQSKVIRIGGRKAIIDTQPHDNKIILVSDLKYAAQDNYVPEKLNGLMKAMSKPDWVDKPIDVMEVNGEYHVLDGHHRALAAIKLGRKKIPARVYKGSKKEAFLEGFTKWAKKEPSIDNTHFDRADIGRSVADDTIPSGVGIPATRRSNTTKTLSKDRMMIAARRPQSYGFESGPGSRSMTNTRVVY